MRRPLIAAVLLAGTAFQAHADTATIGNAGVWRAFGGRATDNQTVCGVSTFFTDGKAVLIKRFGVENALTVQIMKPGWAIPKGTSVPVALSVDSLSPWTATAIGVGDAIEFSIPGNQTLLFLTEMSAGAAARIEFKAGNETSWGVRLNGFSAVLRQWADCLGIQETAGRETQPFSPAPTSLSERRF